MLKEIDFSLLSFVHHFYVLLYFFVQAKHHFRWCQWQSAYDAGVAFLWFWHIVHNMQTLASNADVQMLERAKHRRLCR